MRFITSVSAFAALFALSTAQYTAVGSDPSGNPIGHPELGELMPAGKQFTITWTPTTQDNVSLILLQGPSTNVLPILTIVASTPNTGSYTWDVPTSLAPATTGYGIQLIDSDGTFQYSPQCGISNDAYSGSATTSGGNYITMTLSTGANYTGPPAAATSYASGTGNASVPIVSPTGSMTVPSTLQSTVVVTPTAGTTFFSATQSAAQATASTGAGVEKRVGGVVGVLGLVAAAAALAL